jgi:hypothetical protein
VSLAAKDHRGGLNEPPDFCSQGVIEPVSPWIFVVFVHTYLFMTARRVWAMRVFSV